MSCMDKERIYKLRSEASHIKPLINIGKNGITDSFLEELKKQLKERHLVKIKVLRSAKESGIKETAEELAGLTRSTVIDIRGNSLVLYK